MINYPHKRIFGLIGAPRSGKDTVARYLQESRNFVAFAFADKIKEEFGVSKEDFEAAKISGDIEQLRQKLWDFSAQKKLEDPQYFIRLVMEEVANTEESVVITDIRTEDEFYALFQYAPAELITRVYMVGESATSWESVDGSFSNYRIVGSKISKDFCNKQRNRIRNIYNNKSKGLHLFYRKLEKFFFKEDIMDLSSPAETPDEDPGQDDKSYTIDRWRSIMSEYISQYEIREKI